MEELTDVNGFCGDLKWLQFSYYCPEHAHNNECQLVVVFEGNMTIETPHGVWMVPKGQGVWLPSQLNHQISCWESTKMGTLFFLSEQWKDLREDCFVFKTNSFIKELVLNAIEKQEKHKTPEARKILGVLTDELKDTKAAPFYFPMPKDPRLVKLFNLMNELDGLGKELPELAKNSGATLRTLNNICHKECHMSVSSWRDQFRLLKSFEYFAAEMSVLDVALNIGYDGISGYNKLTKKLTGKSPKFFQGQMKDGVFSK